MNYSSIIITAASVFIFSQSVVAQKGNQFLDRNYWKAKPAVSEIKAAISETNDLAELDKNQFDATVFAINEKNSLETILFLLQQKGNDVNKITHDGRTYLFWAAYSGNLELMKHLVKNGAKTNLLDEHGNTVMIFAASNGLLDQEIYQFLIKNGASLEHEKTTGGANALLCASPFMDDFSLIDFMKSQGISIDSKDDLGNGIFNYAARNGNKDFLSKLIDQGVYFQFASEETYEDLEALEGRQKNKEYEKYEPPESDVVISEPSDAYDDAGFDKSNKIVFNFKEGFFLNTFVKKNLLKVLQEDLQSLQYLQVVIILSITLI